MATISAELKKAVDFFAAEFNYLKKLDATLISIEGKSIGEEEKGLKKGLAVAKYVGKAERRADRKVRKPLRDVLEILHKAKNHELDQAMKEISILRRKRVLENSYYLGTLVRHLNHIHTTIDIYKHYPKRSLQQQIQKEISVMEIDVKEMEKWTAALELRLEQLKEYFAARPGMNRRTFSFLAAGASAAAVLGLTSEARGKVKNALEIDLAKLVYQWKGGVRSVKVRLSPFLDGKGFVEFWADELHVLSFNDGRADGHNMDSLFEAQPYCWLPNGNFLYRYLQDGSHGLTALGVNRTDLKDLSFSRTPFIVSTREEEDILRLLPYLQFTSNLQFIIHSNPSASGGPMLLLEIKKDDYKYNLVKVGQIVEGEDDKEDRLFSFAYLDMPHSVEHASLSPSGKFFAFVKYDIRIITAKVKEIDKKIFLEKTKKQEKGKILAVYDYFNLHEEGYSGKIIGWVMKNDTEYMFFQSGGRYYYVDVDDEDIYPVKGTGQLIVPQDGKKAFLISGSLISEVDPASDTIKPIAAIESLFPSIKASAIVSIDIDSANHVAVVERITNDRYKIWFRQV